MSPEASQDLTDRILTVSRVALFAELKDNPEALLSLCQIMDTRQWPQGHQLIREGDTGDELYILVEGQVSVLRKTPDGEDFKVAILRHEMTPALGEGGLITSDARSATVVCDVKSSFLVLHRKKFEEFSKVHPEWAIAILQKIAIILMGRLKQVNFDLMLLHQALMREIRGA
ncbi:MAG: hypothetical protein C5B49_04840 [Bdellovibrio sp.]|nr:MAG: hypothetical protein C5B49_04840 [Bdellovibrio sp.]